MLNTSNKGLSECSNMTDCIKKLKIRAIKLSYG